MDKKDLVLFMFDFLFEMPTWFVLKFSSNENFGYIESVKKRIFLDFMILIFIVFGVKHIFIPIWTLSCELEWAIQLIYLLKISSLSF